ncbi:MAG: tRNA lysidine(34) synthetase TilS [Xanthomonadaceae bacterium]|nr:tRNA lysidine(34) synthetase TilS [Xanthomonadaceae bacterium]
MLMPPLSAPLLVGFSGGLDSTVLLQRLASTPAVRAPGLRAIHVHHGLSPQADAWAAHCQRVCDALAVPLQVVRVEVDVAAGLGPEGAARAARHAAFEGALQAGEILALAHHRDDQAETFLLRALRGAGVDGLAAMRPWRSYGHGWLWRPLLGESRAALLASARQAQLHWLDDPGNASSDFDRNFLRNQVLPLLRQRWPHAAAALARSAALSAEAADLLHEEDAAALAGIRMSGDTVQIEALLDLPQPRRARVLRLWIDDLQLPPLPANGIARIEADLLTARQDSQARFDWASARVQRWRGLLHAGFIQAVLPAGFSQAWDGRQPLPLPTGDYLRLLGAARFDAPLRVHARQGGERIVLPGRRHSHALKHVLQAASMPPWQRLRLPVLSAGDTVLACGDGIVSAALAQWLLQHRATLQWVRLA